MAKLGGAKLRVRGGAKVSKEDQWRSFRWAPISQVSSPCPLHGPRFRIFGQKSQKCTDHSLCSRNLCVMVVISALMSYGAAPFAIVISKNQMYHCWLLVHHLCWVLYIITPLLKFAFLPSRKHQVFLIFLYSAPICWLSSVSKKLKIQSRRSIGIDSRASSTLRINVDHRDKLTRNSIRCFRRKNQWNPYNLALSCLWHLHDVQRKILIEFGSKIGSSCRISFVNRAFIFNCSTTCTYWFDFLPWKKSIG